MADPSGEARIVRLRLICLAPPEPCDDTPAQFGLQDKQQTLHAGHRRLDGSVCYEFDVRVVPGEANEPRFRGPFVHGTAAAPFLYLSLRRKEPGPAPWIRRLKIALTAITWEQVAAADSPGGACLEATVGGAGSGTVPLLGQGWTLHAAATVEPRS